MTVPTQNDSHWEFPNQTQFQDYTYFGDIRILIFYSTIDVGDKCWRQVLDVDDKSSHQHQDVINIDFVSPLSKSYHRHNLCHKKLPT